MQGRTYEFILTLAFFYQSKIVKQTRLLLVCYQQITQYVAFNLSKLHLPFQVSKNKKKNIKPILFTFN